MHVERIITKEVYMCAECPYYTEVTDMGAIIPYCIAAHKIILDDNLDKTIAKECPIKGESHD